MREQPEKECIKSGEISTIQKNDQYKSLRYGPLINPSPKKKKKKRAKKGDTTVVKCEDCIYYRQIVESTQLWCCNYCLDTGELRGIPPIDCYKKPGTPYRPKRQKRRK